MDPKELKGLMEAYTEVYAPQEEIDEASYSAKAARAGKDIGKPGKAFSKIAASAAKRYGSEESGKKVAGAVLAKLRKEEIEILEDVIDENRMASRMEKMPSAPAKVGKATHSTKDLAPSKEPTPEEKAKARKALGLGEATAMAKMGKDETAIRNKIASSTGGGQSADRAGALADRPTYGQSGIDPKARANYARKQMGDFRKTNSSNPGLHGYGHKSSDPDVKAKQAARGAQRGSATLTPNEKKKLNMGEAYDLYDIILSHLLDEGYADTQEAAEAIMVNMSEEWRDSIVETRMDPRGRPASGPMNVYANPKKPSQSHLDAVKAYDEKQKKKTPEQKQKELDAYMNRKMYS
jgi:hypothetical protein